MRSESRCEGDRYITTFYYDQEDYRLAAEKLANSIDLDILRQLNEEIEKNHTKRAIKKKKVRDLIL